MRPPMFVMLIGGPRDGALVWSPEADEIAENVHGVIHTYKKGANLPGDVLDRLPRQAFPFEPFGYAGPDEKAVEALKAAFPAKADG